MGPRTPALALLSSWRSSGLYSYVVYGGVRGFGALDPSSGTAQLMEVVRLVFFLSLRRCWRLGALDPSSGTAQLMEVVRFVFLFSLRSCSRLWGPGPQLWHCSAHGGHQVSILLKSTEHGLGPWTPALALLSSWRSSGLYSYLVYGGVRGFGALDHSSGTAQLMEVVRLVLLLSLQRCLRLWGPGPEPCMHCPAQRGREVTFTHRWDF